MPSRGESMVKYTKKFDEKIGWKYPWVVTLGTTLRNEKGTKKIQIIFMGLLL
jgi:hypothetical protein